MLLFQYSSWDEQHLSDFVDVKVNCLDPNNRRIQLADIEAIKKLSRELQAAEDEENDNDNENAENADPPATSRENNENDEDEDDDEVEEDDDDDEEEDDDDE